MSDTKSGSPLFDQPWVYEYIYPEASTDTAEACVRILQRFLPGNEHSVLDVGCGTGKVLSAITQIGNRGFGIDASQCMIDYASLLHPELRMEVADMRTFSLQERFDAVLCVGSTFTTNLSNDDVHASLEKFHGHCQEDGLLVLGILNASRFLGTETFSERVETRVDEGDFHATAFSRHMLDRRKQSFRRVRTWRIDGQLEPVIDDAEFRLFFPLELEDYLLQHHFSILGIWDNKDLIETDLSDRRLYIAARAV